MERRKFISILAGLAAVPVAIKGLFGKQPEMVTTGQHRGKTDFPITKEQHMVLDYWESKIIKANNDWKMVTGRCWVLGRDRKGLIRIR